MDDLIVTAKHLLYEFNVSNDTCSRTDHLFQVESRHRQALHDILNEYINNDGEDADSTHRTKLQQLIDNVLSFDPPSRIDDQHPVPPTTCNIASAGGGGQTMTDGYIVVEAARCIFDSVKISVNTSIFSTNFLTRRVIYHFASIQIFSLSWILMELYFMM